MADLRSEQSKEFRDLGFGARVATLSARRLLNQDGSFNTKRKGLGFIGYLSLYNRLLTMSWPAFVALLAVYYLFTNACFALGYSMLGSGALMGAAGSSSPDQFIKCVVPLAWEFSMASMIFLIIWIISLWGAILYNRPLIVNQHFLNPLKNMRVVSSILRALSPQNRL